MSIKDKDSNLRSQSTVDNPYGFTGRRYDSESNLWHYRNRMYSAELGRFLQRDPKGFIDGLNLYAYVKNNPLKYLDAMGTRARATGGRVDSLGGGLSTLWNKRGVIGSSIVNAISNAHPAAQMVFGVATLGASTAVAIPVVAAASTTLTGLAIVHPIKTIAVGEFLNDALNPSMPATTPLGILYNMYQNRDKFFELFE